jgi:thiol-disulfide isomerase/thioredoxin
MAVDRRSFGDDRGSAGSAGSAIGSWRQSASAGAGAAGSAVEDFPDEGAIPSLSGAVQWLNSPPLTPEALKGKVVVVDFWTYSCINCRGAAQGFP